LKEFVKVYTRRVDASMHLALVEAGRCVIIEVCKAYAIA